jgi:predicted protein tyrosine phosphatase
MESPSQRNPENIDWIDVQSLILTCGACDLKTDDEESTQCEVCSAPLSLAKQWTPTQVYLLPQASNQQVQNRRWIYCLNQAFYPSFPFELTLKLFALESKGSILSFPFEANHLDKDIEFWIEQSQQGGLEEEKPVETCLKWRSMEKEKKKEREEAFRLESQITQCEECGETLGSSSLYSFQTHLLVNTHMKEIYPGLFLGAQYNATNEMELKYHHIQSIVNCAKEINWRSKPLHDIQRHYLKVPWEDDHKQNILKDLPKILDWIDTELKQSRKVLVHCALGRSRSVAILIGYLMRMKKISFEEAFYEVKKKKPSAEPNLSFQQQLRSLSTSQERKGIT